MCFKNEFQMKLKAVSSNESFARSVVSAFCVGLNPTIEEINDIKTAVSEAVTNSIVHGYAGTEGDILISVGLNGKEVTIEITDFGVGISDIQKAMEPFYTSKPEQERSGLGFTVMETFMDELDVKPNEKGGVTVVMKKKIGGD